MATVNAELRELVENHLGRGKPDDMAIATVCVGLAAIGAALGVAEDRDPQWAVALGKAREGALQARAGMKLMREASTDFSAVLAFAERQVAFADLLQAEIVRLHADESTLV